MFFRRKPKLKKDHSNLSYMLLSAQQDLAVFYGLLEKGEPFPQSERAADELRTKISAELEVRIKRHDRIFYLFEFLIKGTAVLGIIVAGIVWWKSVGYTGWLLFGERWELYKSRDGLKASLPYLAATGLGASTLFITDLLTKRLEQWRNPILDRLYPYPARIVWA